MFAPENIENTRTTEILVREVIEYAKSVDCIDAEEIQSVFDIDRDRAVKIMNLREYDGIVRLTGPYSAGPQRVINKLQVK